MDCACDVNGARGFGSSIPHILDSRHEVRWSGQSHVGPPLLRKVRSSTKETLDRRMIAPQTARLKKWEPLDSYRRQTCHGPRFETKASVYCMYITCSCRSEE